MGGRIELITQKDFDRIIYIKIKRGEDTKYLAIELFSKGNISLLNNKYEIIHSFKSIKKDNNEKNIYISKNSNKKNPFLIKEDEFINIIQETKEKNEDIEFIISDYFNLGKIYSKEIIYNSKIINKRIKSIQDIRNLYISMKNLLQNFNNKNLKPQIVFNNEHNNEQEQMSNQNMYDVIPIDLNIYSTFKKVYYSSFSLALENFFDGEKQYNNEILKNDIKKNSNENKLIETNIYERRLKQQEFLLNKFEKESKNNISKANIIYNNYIMIENLIIKLNNLRLIKSWQEINQLLKKEKLYTIQNIQPKESVVEININGEKININILKTVNQNANDYYNISKKFIKKINGAKKAIDDTKNMIEKKYKKSKEKKKYIVNSKKYWYEKYRWFISSNNLLVIGGRDADTNEEIFKKYIEKNDLIFHTVDPGSPLVIIKSNGNIIDQQTIMEAAIFCVSYSNSWKKKYSTADCYYIRPNQISKTPESGEYIKKGSFIIRGNKNMLNDIKLELAIGLELKDKTRVISGPLESIKKNSHIYYIIKPGKYNANDIGKNIYKLFRNIIEDRKFLKEIASPEKIAFTLPPGESDIVFN